MAVLSTTDSRVFSSDSLTSCRLGCNMKRPGRSIALAALLLCLSCACVSASPGSRVLDGLAFAEGQHDSTGSGQKAGSNLKDPNAALTYALFPGVIAHGAGHIYAGNVRAGLVLLGSELGGLALYAWGAATGVERGQPSSEGVVAMATGGALFFGSWAYDLIFAPLCVKKKNQELLRGTNAQLRLRARDEQVALFIVWRF